MTGRPRRGKYDLATSDFIDKFWRSNYRPPTVRDVMAGTGITTTSVAVYVLKKLASESAGELSLADNSRMPIPRWVKEAIAGAVA